MCALLLIMAAAMSGCSVAAGSGSQAPANHAGLHYAPGYTGDTEASVYFLPGVSYVTAVRAVADMGLQPLSPCAGAASDHTRWKSADQSTMFSDIDSKGLLQVVATPLSPIEWPKRLLAATGVEGVSVGPAYCPNIGGDLTPMPGQVYFLGYGVQPTYVRVTFSTRQVDAYAASVVEVSDLGFRLADPCFESRRPSPAWHSMSQLSGYEATGALVVATTEANSTRWLAQLSTAPHVMHIEAPYQPAC